MNRRHFLQTLLGAAAIPMVAKVEAGQSLFSEKRIRGEWFSLSSGDLEEIAKRSILV
jgi:hypothetical protein